MNITKIILAASAAALLLCSCGGNGMSKEFAAQKAAAESKSGIVYRTTYFVSSRGEDGLPYPKLDTGSGKYQFVYNNEEGETTALTGFMFEDAREGYQVDESRFLAPAESDGKWGYVLLDCSAPDTEAVTWGIEPQYDNAEFFTENVAAVCVDGLYGVIDINGDVLIAPYYDAIKYSSFGVMPALKDGAWYFIGTDGEKLYGPFEDAESFEYGYAAVKKNGKWGFIDKGGRDATAFVYDEAYSVEIDGGGYCAWVRAGDKWEKVKIEKE